MHLPHFPRALTGALALGSGSPHASDLLQDTPGTQCQRTLKPPGFNSLCGLRGTVAHPSLIGITPHSSLEKCVNTCFEQAACESFSIDTTLCHTYSKKLAQMGFKKSHESSRRFYNKGCYKQTCPNLFADNGNFQMNASWYPWSTSDYDGMQSGIGKGFQSSRAGTAVLAEFFNYDPLEFIATYSADFTYGQIYSFSFDYMPMSDSCHTTISDSGVSTVFFALGTFPGLVDGSGVSVGEPVTVGKWSHHATTFLLPPLPKGEVGSKAFQLSTYCANGGNATASGDPVAYYDNFVSRPLPVAPYPLRPKRVGPNLVKNPGFESKNLADYEVVKSFNATTAFTSPGFNGSSHALNVTVPAAVEYYDNIFDAAGVLLGQTIPIKAGKVYSVSLAYKIISDDKSDDYFCLTTMTGLDPKVPLKNLTEPFTMFVPPLLELALLGYKTKDWTIANGVFSPALDNERLVISAVCTYGNDTSILIDDIEVYEVA